MDNKIPFTPNCEIFSVNNYSSIFITVQYDIN